MIREIFDIIFPVNCKVCDKPLEKSRYSCLCAECWNQIKFIFPPVCKRCGKPFNAFRNSLAPVIAGDVVADSSAKTKQSDFCLECKQSKNTFYFKCARSAGIYEGVLREAIHLFKYKNKRSLGKHFGEILVNYAQRENIMVDIDIIIPVPLHKSRLQERDYNQSEILASFLKDKFNLPMHKNILKRSKQTQSQVGLKRNERFENIKDAFIVDTTKNNITDKSILLIDDIMTTGATINECARVLTESGAKEVNVLTLARDL
ncbi:MAG: ComF family protein [Candidatus Firestonebacteria bacterium]